MVEICSSGVEQKLQLSQLSAMQKRQRRMALVLPVKASNLELSMVLLPPGSCS